MEKNGIIGTQIHGEGTTMGLLSKITININLMHRGNGIGRSFTN
jgi:hypothetical protein